MRAFYTILFGALFAAACGGSSPDNGTADSGQSPEAGDQPDASAPVQSYPAFKVDAPRVDNLGGPVLATPKITPVFFPGFDYATELADFSSKIGASSYWTPLAEYGVGPLVSNTPITLTSNDAAPNDITDADIKAWLTSRFDGTHPEFGNTPDPNTIYTLFYPPTTNIWLSGGPSGDGGTTNGMVSCQSFGGYHDDVIINGQTIPYAVLPECPSFGSLTKKDAVTTATSHELSEAATDPYPTDNTAYGQVDLDHIGWEFFLGGGEVGDMCAQFSSAYYTPTDLPYVVQRNWSNASAKAGHDPCQPADTAPYFNTLPIFPDKVTARGGIPTKGVLVPVGQSKTIQLELFSDSATNGVWQVSAEVRSRNGQSPITATLDATSGQNGDKLNLTLTSTAAVTSSSHTATLVVTSQLGSRKNVWVGIVAQQ